MSDHDPALAADSDPGGFTLAWGLCLVLFVSFLLFAAPVQALHPPYGIWFTELFFFLGLTWMALRLTGRDPIHYPRLGVPGGTPLGMSFLAGTLNFFAVVIPLQFVAQALAPPELLARFDASQIFERQRPVDLGFIVAGIGFAAPICEEYFFRGVLLRGMSAARMTTFRALFVTSVIFSAFHLDPIGFVARVELGFLFGYLYLRTGSLWPAVMAHAANNLVSTTAFFLADAYSAGGGNDAPPPAWGMATLVLAFGVPLYLVLRWFHHRAPLLATGTDAGPRGLRRKELWIWLGGAVASMALLMALDWRTVVVNGSDLITPVRKPAATASPAAQSAYEQLEELGRAARRGEVPIDDYVKAKEAARADSAAKQTPASAPDAPPVPAPIPAPPTP